MGKLESKPTIDIGHVRGFAVRFPLNDNDPKAKTLIDVMKMGLPAKGAWDPVRRAWIFGESHESIEAIKMLAKYHGFQLTETAKLRLAGQVAIKTEWGVEVPQGSKLVARLKEALFEHQEAAVKFIKHHKRVLLADDVGVGKTFTSLASVEEMACFPVLVICPANVKKQWANEIKTKLHDHTVQIINGRKPVKLEKVDFLIINDELLAAHMEAIKAWDPKCVIADEAHRYKNFRAGRTKVVEEILQRREYRLCLTGTPLPNGDIRELAAILGIVGVIQDLGGYHRVVDQHGIFADTGYGKRCVGIRHMDHLKDKLNRSIMVARLRRDVNGSLPEKTRVILNVDNQNKKGYADAAKKLVDFIDHATPEQIDAMKRRMPGAGLAVVSALRLEAGLGKIEAAVEWADERLVVPGRTVLIFTHHVEVAEKTAAAIQALGYPTSLYTGQVASVDGKPANRDQSKDAFTSGKTRALVATMASIGTGVDGLQKVCSDGLFAEFPWTPGEIEQAEGRIDRTGQTEPMNIGFLVANGTYDDDMTAVLQIKSKNIGALMGPANQKDKAQLLHAILKSVGRA